MKTQELADTVLRQIECLWILQELSHELSSGNQDAKRFLEFVYQRRNPNIDWKQLDFLELKTTLAMLILPTCPLSRLNDDELSRYGFSLQVGHDLVYMEDARTMTSAKASAVLTTMRNALAHLPDFAGSNNSSERNVLFDKGTLHLQSLGPNGKGPRKEVVFQNRPGFVSFVGDVIKAARQFAVALGNDR